MDTTPNETLATESQVDTTQILEFIGTPNQEQFDAYSNQLYKDAKEAGISPLQNVLLNLNINSIYGSALPDNEGSFSPIFNAIATLSGVKDIELANGSKIQMGKIQDTGETAGPQSAKQYRLPHIVKA